MANTQTIARPYARAAFDVAVATNALAAWSSNLGRLASLAADADAARLVSHPAVTDQQLDSLFTAALDAEAPAGAANLVRLLAQNGRLSALPFIAPEFEQLRARHERRQDIDVASASEIAAPQREAIAAALGKRLGVAVDVSWRVDAELLGGAVISAGDTVIDGSVRGELERLRSSITN